MEMINSFKEGGSQGIRVTKLGACKAFYAFSVLMNEKLTQNVPPDARNLIYKNLDVCADWNANASEFEHRAKMILDKIIWDDALNVLDKFCIFLCNCKINECHWYSEGWVMNKLSELGLGQS